MITTAFFTWLGVSLGNFIHQLFTKKNWSTAIERSFFQAVPMAILVMVLS